MLLAVGCETLIFINLGLNMSKTEVEPPMLMRDGISEVSVHALALRLKSNWQPFSISN